MLTEDVACKWRVDPRKAKNAIWRYRFTCVWVFVINGIFNYLSIFLLCYVMSSNAHIAKYAATVLLGWGLGFLLLIFFLSDIVCLYQRKSSSLLVGCVQGKIPEYYLYTAEWNRECAHAGIYPGEVYIVSSSSVLGVTNFALMNSPCFIPIPPTLLVSERMVGRFTLPELRAVMGHECGHIRHLPNVARRLNEDRKSVV